MPTIAVAPARIPYRVEGSGPDLVLVHGTGPGAGFTWNHLVDQFSDRHTVILPDLSGSEAAVDDGGALSLEMLAAQVIAVIEDAGQAPADLVGFSLGAPVVAAVAATRPDLVRRLVLVAGFARPDEYLRNLVIAWQRLGELDAGVFGRFGALTAFRPAFLDQLGAPAVEEIVANWQPTPGMLRQIDLIPRVDLSEVVQEIAADTLVIGASQDRTVPVEHSRRLHAAIPRSTYVEVDRGHVLLMEDPAEFVRLVREFLDRS